MDSSVIERELIDRELRIAKRQAEFWAQREANLRAEQARLRAG